jgi:hypothetical protein
MALLKGRNRLSQLLFALLAGFVLLTAPLSVTGCSSSTTVSPTAPILQPKTVRMFPPVPAQPVAANYRILVRVPRDSTPAAGTMVAGGATFIPSGVQILTEKTVFIPDLGSSFSPISEFSEMLITNLTGGATGTDFSQVCFEVQNLTTLATVASSPACNGS